MNSTRAAADKDGTAINNQLVKLQTEFEHEGAQNEYSENRIILRISRLQSPK